MQVRRSTVRTSMLIKSTAIILWLALASSAALLKLIRLLRFQSTSHLSYMHNRECNRPLSDVAKPFRKAISQRHLIPTQSQRRVKQHACFAFNV